jgi:hypothetical protein
MAKRRDLILHLLLKSGNFKWYIKLAQDFYFYFIWFFHHIHQASRENKNTQKYMRSTKHFIFQNTLPQGGREIPLDNATFNKYTTQKHKKTKSLTQVVPYIIMSFPLLRSRCKNHSPLTPCELRASKFMIMCVYVHDNA